MKKSKLKVVSLVVAAIMSMTFVVTGTSSKVAANESDELEKTLKEMLLSGEKSKINEGDKFSGIEGLSKEDENSILEQVGDPKERVRVIVELVDMPATMLLEDGEQPSEDLIQSVKEAQIPIQEEVKEETGEEIRHVYGNLINGFSMEVERQDIEKIKEVDGVVEVREANVYYPTMNSAKEFTEALTVWEDYGYKGEGLVVAVIDTGIDPSHKDMKLSDTSKAKLNKESVNNIGPGKFYTDKVPYGYNFADKDEEIVDTSGSMHGMHVAGIVAANGSKEEVENNTAIQGMAPEAQVLAMKVFKNDPNDRYAYSDDIIAALEVSVQVGADIVNMSLGADAGYRDAEDPEQIAVKNAADDGVICVISAGNAATSLNPYLVEGVSDTATAGTPGLAADALQVASSDNSNVTLPAMSAVINGETKLMGYTDCDVNPLDIFTTDTELELVDCGVGNIEDFSGKDLSGKAAFIERGEIAFVDKQINAQSAGASAVIIYNNKANEANINMATDPSISIPAIFITKENADIIKGAASLSEVKVSFKGAVTTGINPTGAEMSSYTSWGPAPDLGFAPQITAPGGNIYSTLNDNRYGSMSGTSMAAPHVAGATALIIQGLKANGIELKGRELIEYVKKTIINTAKTLTETNKVGEENIPYSPRRQGSGIIQTKAAIDNRVLVTGEDKEATVSLKEIGDTTEFKLTLTNYSDKEEKYTVESLGDVLTAFTPSMAGGEAYTLMAFDTILEGASLTFSNNEITVPANGEAEVNVTLNVVEGSVSNNFVEGFIKFVAVDKETPSLVVPYMGYYGDWSAEKIIDGAVWDEAAISISPSFGATKVNDSYYYLGFEGKDENGVIINPEKMVISPNADRLADEFVPALYLLRNAKNITVDLLDENKEVIANDIKGDVDFRKKILSVKNGNSADVYSNIAWDGTIYNKSTGSNETVEEGQYYLNYKAKVDGENSEYQSFIMPVKIDVTPIKTNLLSSTSIKDSEYKLEVDFGGELENGNLQEVIVLVNGEEFKEYALEGDKLVANLNLDSEDNTIIVGTSDNAYNIGIDVFKISKEIVVSKASNLKAEEATNNSVILSWQEPEYTVGLVEYVIYKDGKEFTKVPYGTNNAKIEGLKANTIYGFKVTAKYSNGEESKPVSVNVRTKK